MDKESFCKIILFFLLIFYFIFLTASKIDLTRVDLGRHLKTGELVFKKEFPLFTNFYSYTHPNFPTINHHWGSGPIFFLIKKFFGFVGLSIFYLMLSLIGFLLCFHLAVKNSNFNFAFIISLLTIPLMAERREIRPEIFSYFFSILFFWILWHYIHNLINFRWLFILPFLQIFWVNLHIYFFLGPFLIAVFLFDRFIAKSKNKKFEIKILILIFLLTVIFSLLNPFGLKGIFYPFNIFKNYGYRIVENQSICFLERLGFIKNPNFFIFKMNFTILFLSFALVLIFNRRSFSSILFILSAVFSTMAWLAIRNFSIFGFFTLPIISYNLKSGLSKKFDSFLIKTNWKTVILILVVFIFVCIVIKPTLIFQRYNFGFGLKPDNNSSAEFFKMHNIRGPILNNYDIGGYLIYHLYPDERVFVDNRPEAYPSEFFQKIYIPLQEDEKTWREQDRIYNFNVIFFSHRDMTPWAQKFLIERLNDPDWTPVFADNYAIIFLKRNDLNRPIIENYEVPKNYFKIIEYK